MRFRIKHPGVFGQRGWAVCVPVTLSGSGRDPPDQPGTRSRMPSAAAASSGSPATDLVKSTAGATRVLTRLAVAGIASSILIMIAMSLVRDSWMCPPMAGTGAAPPWDLRSLHVSAGGATVALSVSVPAGAGGGGARLVALQRGARPRLPARLVSPS